MHSLASINQGRDLFNKAVNRQQRTGDSMKKSEGRQMDRAHQIPGSE